MDREAETHPKNGHYLSGHTKMFAACELIGKFMVDLNPSLETYAPLSTQLKFTGELEFTVS